MPTPYIKKMAIKHNMTVQEAEEKWLKAKEAVDKNKYDDIDSYYAVVTSIFNKWMKEKIESVLSFNKSMKKTESD